MQDSSSTDAPALIAQLDALIRVYAMQHQHHTVGQLRQVERAVRGLVDEITKLQTKINEIEARGSK